MRAQKNKTRISLNPGYACSLNGTLRKHRSRHRQNRPLQVYIPLGQPRLFGAIERDGDYGSSAVLKPPRDHLGYRS
jgi:hypothetical protein